MSHQRQEEADGKAMENVGNEEVDPDGKDVLLLLRGKKRQQEILRQIRDRKLPRCVAEEEERAARDGGGEVSLPVGMPVCPVCKDACLMPLVSSKCGHSVCGGCRSFGSSDAERGTCPVCMAAHTSFVRNRALEETIEAVFEEWLRGPGKARATRALAHARYREWMHSERKRGLASMLTWILKGLPVLDLGALVRGLMDANSVDGSPSVRGLCKDEIFEVLYGVAVDNPHLRFWEGLVYIESKKHRWLGRTANPEAMCLVSVMDIQATPSFERTQGNLANLRTVLERVGLGSLFEGSSGPDEAMRLLRGVESKDPYEKQWVLPLGEHLGWKGNPFTVQQATRLLQGTVPETLWSLIRLVDR